MQALDAAREAGPSKPTRKKCRKQDAQEDKHIRKELVERVRREIEAGTYDTPEKWDAALDRLLERMNGD
jgi:anti-sigma28 factor (negative regulator of flagellin synthesis)